jgi:ABC-2 type transport system ATP-binding protein
MFQLHHITKIFKSDLLTGPFVALDDVSFGVPQGTMVGFLGANGAGKTTTLKILLGFIKASSGHIEFSRSMGSSRFEIMKKIGFLPERPYYYQHLTGKEFACFMGELSGLSRTKVLQQLPTLSRKLHLDHAMHRELKTYSKGMLQRIGFLVTILHGPELVLLDEPLSGLDPVGRKELKDVMVELKNEGRTIFFSTHIVPDVEEICDRVVFLNKGKLSYDGPVQPLLEQHAKGMWRVNVLASQYRPIDGIEFCRELGAGILQLLVSSDNKAKVLEALILQKVDILSLEQDKVRLEEIFYQTGQSV